MLGAPVYGGRLPAVAIERFERIKAAGTLAVPVVVYGNREFEDALLELKNLALELGFQPVAGGAFVGEHSFETEDSPIAHGRPDGQDAQKAVDFGAKTKDKVAALASPEALGELEIPGRFPYEGGATAMSISPVSRKRPARYAAPAPRCAPPRPSPSRTAWSPRSSCASAAAPA